MITIFKIQTLIVLIVKSTLLFGADLKVNTIEVQEYVRAEVGNLLSEPEIASVELVFQDGAGAVDFPGMIFDYGALYANISVENYEFPLDAKLSIKFSLQGRIEYLLTSQKDGRIVEYGLKTATAGFREDASKEAMEDFLNRLQESYPEMTLRYFESMKMFTYQGSSLAGFLSAYKEISEQDLIKSNDLDLMFYRVPFEFDKAIVLPEAETEVFLSDYRGIWNKLLAQYSEEYGFPFISCPALAKPFGDGPHMNCKLARVSRF